MTTRVYLPAYCKAHDPVPRHPECPQRLTAIEKNLNNEPVSGVELSVNEHRLAAHNTALAHDERYVDMLFEQSPDDGIFALDGDTMMDAQTLNAALVAAGTVEHAINAVINRDIDNGFCAVRPPGHHAEYASGMGFCFLNTIALGALMAIRDHGVERIAILDFDVHHGNGTQDICAGNEQILFCSSYQHPHYPYRNDASIEQSLVNVPLPAGTASGAFRQALEQRWWPELERFAPDLILVSAGFDAHREDPLADLRLETDDYAWLGQVICDKADALCDGRVVAVLEGGYNLTALADSTRAFVNAMAGH